MNFLNQAFLKSLFTKEKIKQTLIIIWAAYWRLFVLWILLTTPIIFYDESLFYVIISKFESYSWDTGILGFIFQFFIFFYLFFKKQYKNYSIVITEEHYLKKFIISFSIYNISFLIFCKILTDYIVMISLTYIFIYHILLHGGHFGVKMEKKSN